MHFHGVSAPRLKEIERRLFEEVRSAWEPVEAIRFCDILIRSRFVESKHLGALLLGRFHQRFGRDLLDTVEGWLSGGLCDNWAVVDGLCPCVVTPLVRRFPDLIPRVMRWPRSRNIWLRRASAVTFVPLARRGERLDSAYFVARLLLVDREDLIHKAVGWLLREAGRTDPGRLEAFLLRHGPRIPRTTLRYAIERFPQAKRRALLARTRPTSPASARRASSASVDADGSP